MGMNIKAYLPAFGILVVIGILHNIGGIVFNAYDVWWWDILLHFLGGVWLALSGFWFFYYSRFVKGFLRTAGRFFFATLVPVLIIGLAWEVFEYMFGLTFVLPGERWGVDTIGDVFVDIAGGMAVYLYYRLKYWIEFCKE